MLKHNKQIGYKIRKSCKVSKTSRPEPRFESKMAETSSQQQMIGFFFQKKQMSKIEKKRNIMQNVELN